MDTLLLSLEELLTTTRAVRKRLDLTRSVSLDLIRECLTIACWVTAAGIIAIRVTISGSCVPKWFPTKPRSSVPTRNAPYPMVTSTLTVAVPRRSAALQLAGV